MKENSDRKKLPPVAASDSKIHQIETIGGKVREICLKMYQFRIITVKPKPFRRFLSYCFCNSFWIKSFCEYIFLQLGLPLAEFQFSSHIFKIH